jgi:hypothetical protein
LNFTRRIPISYSIQSGFAEVLNNKTTVLVEAEKKYKNKWIKTRAYHMGILFLFQPNSLIKIPVHFSNCGFNCT